jgi:hypothetical protein
MPQPNAAGADGRGGQTLQVVDFRAGIVNNSTVYDAPFVRVNTIGSPLSLSQVTASAATYNCIAMGNGGLAPLPKPQPWQMPTVGNTGPYYDATTGEPYQLCGGLLFTEAQFGSAALALETPKSIIMALRTYTPDTGYPLNVLLEYNLAVSGWTVICSDEAQQPAQACTGWLTPLYPFISYYQNGASPYLTEGDMDPTIFFSTWTGQKDQGEASSNIVLGYDMTLDTEITSGVHVNPFSPFILGSGRRGILFGHQLRTGFWQEIGNGICNLLSYIDPVLSDWQASTNPDRGVNPDIGLQYEVFQAVNPSSVTAWGTYTTGDLLVITDEGGGFIVSGDFYDPTVTICPGIQSSGGLVGVPAMTPSGLVYISADNGAWVWDGGATATKISSQISDNFYGATDGPATSLGNYSQGSFYSVMSDGDLIFFSNNWVYNTTLGSWWQIGSAVEGYPYMWYVSVPDNVNANEGGGRTHRIYMAPGVFNDNELSVGAYWDKKVPADDWQWQSNPILLDDGYIFDIRQIMIQLSGPATSTFTMTLTDAGNGSTLATKTIIPDNTGPQWFRYNTPATTQSFIVTIKAIDTATPPSVPMLMYGFDIIYNTRYPVAVN